MSTRPLTDRDHIWDRACYAATREKDARLRLGDQQLAAVLALDSAAHNGGVLHAIGVVGPAGLELALEGFTFFGLPDARAVVEEAARIAAQPTGRGDHERRLDFAYESSAAIPEAVDRHLTLHPENFAPLAPHDRESFGPILKPR